MLIRVFPTSEIIYDNWRPSHRNSHHLMVSIKETGLKNPITITENKELMDGLGRLRACLNLGVRSMICNVIDSKTTKLMLGRGLRRTALCYQCLKVTTDDFMIEDKLWIEVLNKYEAILPKECLLHLTCFHEMLGRDLKEGELVSKIKSS